METATKRQLQYDRLFDLFCDYVERYSEETEGVYRDLGWKWDAWACKFEVAVYFLFEICACLRTLRHDKEVWKEICAYFQDRLIRIFTDRVRVGEPFGYVIAMRVQEYGETLTGAMKNNESCDSEVVRALLWHLDAANSDIPLTACHPLVLRDGFEFLTCHLRMYPIQMGLTLEFRCCLERIFEATSDLRSLSAEEMETLIEIGKEEARRLTSELTKEQVRGTAFAPVGPTGKNSMLSRLSAFVKSMVTSHDPYGYLGTAYFIRRAGGGVALQGEARVGVNFMATRAGSCFPAGVRGDVSLVSFGYRRNASAIPCG